MSQLNLPVGDDPEELLPRDGSAVLHPEVWSSEEAARLMDALLDEVPWEQRQVTMFGKKVDQPRLVAWFGDAGTYTYSGLTLEPHKPTPTLRTIQDKVEELAGTEFNSVLANLYRDGQDTVSWHADDEPELGPDPIIASVSLGAERRFDLRHREDGTTIRTVLPSGSVLVMSGASQRAWVHQVPRTKKVDEPRINLTFRRLEQA